MKVHKEKMLIYIFYYQKFVHLGENTSIYCSQIIVVHVHATVFFLKFTQHVTILLTVHLCVLIHIRIKGEAGTVK